MQKLPVKRDSVILARGWLASSAVGRRDVVASYSPEGCDFLEVSLEGDTATITWNHM